MVNPAVHNRPLQPPMAPRMRKRPQPREAGAGAVGMARPLPLESDGGAAQRRGREFQDTSGRHVTLRIAPAANCELSRPCGAVSQNVRRHAERADDCGLHGLHHDRPAGLFARSVPFESSAVAAPPDVRHPRGSFRHGWISPDRREIFRAGPLDSTARRSSRSATARQNPNPCRVGDAAGLVGMGRAKMLRMTGLDDQADDAGLPRAPGHLDASGVARAARHPRLGGVPDAATRLQAEARRSVTTISTTPPRSSDDAPAKPSWRSTGAPLPTSICGSRP